MRSAPRSRAASRKCLNLISRLHSTSGLGVRPAAYSARKWANTPSQYSTEKSRKWIGMPSRPQTAKAAPRASFPGGPVDPVVVAGGGALGAQCAGGVEEMLGLDLAVAQHVRVGRAPGRVLGQEVGEHAVPVLAGEIAEGDRDAEPAADGNGVAAVVLGPAVAAAVVGPVLHEQTRARLAGIAQQQRGHGGIDAAGQIGRASWRERVRQYV